jgi:hypothetical protein
MVSVADTPECSIAPSNQRAASSNEMSAAAKQRRSKGSKLKTD